MPKGVRGEPGDLVVHKRKKRRRSSRSKVWQIAHFLKTDEARGMTRREVAKRFNCHDAYVTMVAGRIGMARPYASNKNKVKVEMRSPSGETSVRYFAKPPENAQKPIQPPEKKINVTEKDIGAIVDSNTLSTQEQREHLSWLALNATRDEARVAAHRALQQLDQALGVQTKLGPGEPLTREGRIFRLSLLMEACGKDVVEESMRRVFHAVVHDGTVAESASGNRDVLLPETHADDATQVPVVSDALPTVETMAGSGMAMECRSVQVVVEETHALDHVPIPGEPASPPPLLRPEESQDDREELALRPSVSVVEE